jgi:hypothetical protein
MRWRAWLPPRLLSCDKSSSGIRKNSAASEIHVLHAINPAEPHGDADTIVPLQQSESFAKKAQEVGASHVELVIRPGKGHGWGDFWRSAEDVKVFADWFDRYLRDRAN